MSNTSFKIYNFISCSYKIFYVSIFLCVISCIFMIIYGFNLGLDFTGGILVEIVSDQNLDIIKIQNSLIQEGFRNSVVQYCDNFNSIIIRIPIIKNIDYFNQKIKIQILSIFQNSISQSFSVHKINWIGPNLNKDLMETVVIALTVALICIFLYIAFRFELKSAISTVISLIHDIIIILGILSVCYIEINVTIIAALISVISYSVNDKVIIFDRIRENFYRMPQLCPFKIFNISLSQVLNRTVITSVTTIMVLLVLLIFGKAILYEFSIILLLGIIIGTISSVYIASFLAFKFKVKHESFIKYVRK